MKPPSPLWVARLLVGATLVAVSALWFRQSARPVGDRRLIRLSRETGVPLRWLQALDDVESRDTDDVIRFEPHVFLRLRPDLVGRIPYTDNGRGFSTTPSQTNRAAFARAWSMAGAGAAAIKATSWGRWQVLGWALLELEDDPMRAPAFFYSSPAAVSDDLLVRWFKRNPSAVDAAKREDVEGFARVYNGPNNVAAYSLRLSAALEAA